MASVGLSATRPADHSGAARPSVYSCSSYSTIHLLLLKIIFQHDPVAGFPGAQSLYGVVHTRHRLEL